MYKILLTAIVLFTSIVSFAQSKDTTVSFQVSGVCGMCKERIEKSVKLKGVSKARWSTATHLLDLTYKPSVISLSAIIDKIVATGHDTEFKKASEDIYKQLPDCCLYKDTSVHNDDAPDEHEHAVHEEKILDTTVINGVVVKEDKKGNFQPLSGATIHWLGSTEATTADQHGEFHIPIIAGFSQLVISYTGFTSDTLEVTQPQMLQVVLGSNNVLKTIVVSSRKRNMYVNSKDPFRITNIGSGELMKAACCNLSESFETNPSVDVQYSDAVTGSKQIQLLGLSGVYTQLTVENLPGPRGLSTPLGLNSIAGPWVESIQLSKGTGSVVNGFESIAGQINVELKKPGEKDELLANAYVNSQGKTDLNLNLSKNLNKKWATTLLLHDDFQYNKTDMNNDGFRDMTTGNVFSAVSRWEYHNNSFSSEFGGKIWTDNRVGGELAFEPSQKFTTQHYGLGFKTNRYEGFIKAGYLFPEKKYKSIGLQLSTFRHESDAYLGLRNYTGEQQNFYANLIYQSIIGNTKHKFRTGLNFNADNYKEIFEIQTFKRNEQVSGGFFEYTYGLDKFTVVSGIRADYNNLFGWFFTPRINARYTPFEKTVIRLSAGRGQRTANIFAENLGSFVSSRQLRIIPSINGKAYGLNPEVAWNKGISIDQKFKLFKKDISLALDFFRNDFTDQVVVDMEQPGYISFYNLNGKSYSNSFQAEINFVPVKNLETRMAYRWFDVKTMYGGELKQRPLTARNRAFINAAYSINNWKFDATYSYTGTKRIPDVLHPSSHTFPATSPSFGMLLAQLSHTFGKKKNFEVYLGGENLTNFLQMESIIGANQPFSREFDASMIWGPINGRLFYTGFRYTLK